MENGEAIERVKRLADSRVSFEDVVRSISLDDILEASPDAVVIVDQQGHIIYTNKRTCTLFRYARGKLIGAEIEILIPGRFHEIHREHRRQYVEDPQPRMMGNEQATLFGITSAGVEFPVEISLAHANADAGMVVILHIRKKSG